MYGVIYMGGKGQLEPRVCCSVGVLEKEYGGDKGGGLFWADL